MELLWCSYLHRLQARLNNRSRENFAHWGRVALVVAGKTGSGLGSTRRRGWRWTLSPFRASPADFSGERDQGRERGSDKAVEVDPIVELRRINRRQGMR